MLILKEAVLQGDAGAVVRQLGYKGVREASMSR
jgi:hypothetical protein